MQNVTKCYSRSGESLSIILLILLMYHLGRFRQCLLQSGNLEKYIERPASSFNPCAVKSLMRRTLVSVSWDGYLYDCDFNLTRGLFLGGRKIHISEMYGPPELGSAIAVADHCYTCTAGVGFT